MATSVKTRQLADAAVTLAKMADMATASLLGRNTAGTGVPEVLSAATAKTLLSLNNVDNTSDATKNAASATLTNKVISLPANHGSNNTYFGDVIEGLNAGATLAQWDVVYLDGSSVWLLADANGTNTYPARGMTVTSRTNGQAATIMVKGTVRFDTWNWTPGGTIYLSATAGGLTQTAPSASGDKIQAIGFALTADIAYFDFNSVYLTKT